MGHLGLSSEHEEVNMGQHGKKTASKYYAQYH
jgi:hypothetical protein